MRTHTLADLPGAMRDLAGWLEPKLKRMDRLYVQRVRMARFGPDVHFATTREIEDPFRVGKSVILHLEPFRPGIVIGWYSKDGLPEHEALLRAVTTNAPPREDLDEFDEDVLQKPAADGGLRYSQTFGSAVRVGRPDAGVDAARNVRTGR